MAKYIGKIFLCALISLVGIMAGGMFSTALRLKQPEIPEAVDLRLLGLYTFVAGVVLSIALAELSRRLRGNRRARFAIIAWFAYAWLGINNTIEACIFTTIGGGPAMAVTMLLPCLFVAAAVVLLFSGRQPETSFFGSLRQFFASRTTAQWTVRLSAAVLAFPIVYFTFGMPVGLIVGDYYRHQAFGLRMPSLSVVIGVHCVRSLISLLAALPISCCLAGFAAAVCLDVWLEPVRRYRTLRVDSGLLDAVDDAKHSHHRTSFGFRGLWRVARRIAVVPSAGTQPCGC